MNTKEQKEEKIEYSVALFIREYMNDHNGGTPRWLRSVFFNEKEKIEKILEYMHSIESSARSLERKAVVEMCEKMKKISIPNKNGALRANWRTITAYNQALSDIIHNLGELE